ncbi:hypothetical protein VSU19_11585 [Verrucomicrobiales bacterium BCK34]|nr:hypothetical protein [Verrucomicrobiales bacterium BCK34]
MKNRFFLIASLILNSVVASPANDAALNDGGEGPEPIGWRSGTESIIQMKSEHLDIHFGVEKTKVIARFTFLSHKKGGSAIQKLGFPNASRSEMDGDIIGPIENLVSRVNGKTVEAKLVEGYYKEILKPDGSVFREKVEKPKTENYDGSIQKHAWYVIEVEFPEGEEVIIEREYDCPTGIDSSMNAFFIYETRTGGAWRDEIEKLTAEVTFADDVHTEYVTFDPKDNWTWSEDRSKATLVWENFEPRTSEEQTYFQVSVLNLEEIKRVSKENPDDFPSVEEWIIGWKKMQSE